MESIPYSSCNVVCVHSMLPSGFVKQIAAKNCGVCVICKQRFELVCGGSSLVTFLFSLTKRVSFFYGSFGSMTWTNFLFSPQIVVLVSLGSIVTCMLSSMKQNFLV